MPYYRHNKRHDVLRSCCHEAFGDDHPQVFSGAPIRVQAKAAPVCSR